MQHLKSLHPLEKVKLKCGSCGLRSEAEHVYMNHQGSFREGGRGVRREWGECGMWMNRSNFARHVKGCRERRQVAAVGRSGSC